MIEYLEKEGSNICRQVYEYSKKWKQPINVAKTVAQLFHTQVKRPKINVMMNDHELEIVKEFKYLGFTWTDKLSMKPTVERCIGNIHRTLGKLKWLKAGRTIESKVLRQCFFAYSFPHFAWVFSFFPLLPGTQQKALEQKFRVGLLLVHRCPFVSANKLYAFTAEQPLEFYVKRYIRRRLRTMHTTDLGTSLFYNDIFVWDDFHKRKNDHLSHLFRMHRVRQLIEGHESYLLRWMHYEETK